MSIKTSVEEWVRKGPTQALAVMAAVALVIGAVGFGAGYKIEQSRTRSDVKKLQQELRASTPPGQIRGSGPLGQRVGKVTASKPGSITVATKKGGSQKINTTAATLFNTAVEGSTTDIVAGRRVLLTPGGGEIIVLSAESKIGRVVSKVARDFFTITRSSGATAARLKMADVKVVSTLKSGTSADIKSGVRIIAGGRAPSDNVFNAVEVIVLPADSSFGS